MTDSASTWIKAQRSYATSQCVELAATENGIEMRNSNHPETVIAHAAAEFAVFLEAAKNGEFDHLVSAEPAG
jgi:hypothetical protein